MNNSHQKGFSLVSAIFLLVVIAALGAFAVTLSTTQHQSQALDVMGSRAYQAARAGVEWAAYQVSQSPQNASAPAGCATSFVPNTLGGMLSPFGVAVACNAASHAEGTTTIWVYDITSTASGVNGAQPGQPDYVERVISVKMGR